MAVPIASVNVGVTKMRRKFDALFVPSIPHAPINGPAGACPKDAIAAQACHHAVATLVELHGTGASKLRGEMGQTAGIVMQYGVTPISTRVSALNIGNQADGLIHFIESGIPKMLSEFPGASGAQFRGLLRHPPPPNPQASPSIRFCAILVMSATDRSSNPILN